MFQFSRLLHSYCTTFFFLSLSLSSAGCFSFFRIKQFSTTTREFDSLLFLAAGQNIHEALNQHRPVDFENSLEDERTFTRVAAVVFSRSCWSWRCINIPPPFARLVYSPSVHLPCCCCCCCNRKKTRKKCASSSAYFFGFWGFVRFAILFLQVNRDFRELFSFFQWEICFCFGLFFFAWTHWNSLRWVKKEEEEEFN